MTIVILSLISVRNGVLMAAFGYCVRCWTFIFFSFFDGDLRQLPKGQAAKCSNIVVEHWLTFVCPTM